MISGERENTWAREEKSEGYRLEARQMECLRVKGEEDIGSKCDKDHLRKIPG